MSSTDKGLRIFRNTFRACNIGVNISPGARCLLGNLGNASTADDGGNQFAPSNTWHIRNNSVYVIKAEGNGFGTQLRSEINAKIRDRRDSASLGKVDFIPLIGGVVPASAPPLALTAVAAVPTPHGVEIVFALSAPAQTQARILNIAGRPVRTLCHAAECEAGANRLLWDAQSNRGLPVPNGTYLVELTAKAGDGTQARALGQVRVSR